MYRYLLTVLFLMSGYTSIISASQDDKFSEESNTQSIALGLSVYKKSNCAFCHGWSGDGRGHPRSPGAAAIWRLSVLDKDAMTYLIRCGVIGGAMPYHDRMAYKDSRCVAEPAKIETALLPQKGKNISAGKLEALVDYIYSRVLGKGIATFEQCEAYFKPGSRNCLYLQ